MKKANKMTPFQLNEIARLTKEGMTAYKISKKLKINPSVARYHSTKLKADLVVAPTIVTSEPNILDAYNQFKNENTVLKQKNKMLLQIVNAQLGA